MDLEDVRLAVFTGFARQGRPPTVEEIAQQHHAVAGEVRDALGQLAAARHVVLDDSGSILMAHPFSAVPMGFSVMGQSTLTS